MNSDDDDDDGVITHGFVLLLMPPFSFSLFLDNAPLFLSNQQLELTQLGVCFTTGRVSFLVCFLVIFIVIV